MATPRRRAAAALGFRALDEVTSRLDAVNETALRDTAAAVARTLSTVTTADRIVVMDAGRVRGGHAQ